jgi:hypothetical protein
MSSRRAPPRPKALLLLLTGVVVLLTVVLVLLTKPSASALVWALAAVVVAAIGTVGLNLGVMAIRHQIDRRRGVEGTQKVHRMLPESESPDEDVLGRVDQLEQAVQRVLDRLERLEQEPTRSAPEQAGLERRLPEGQSELAQFVESLSQLEELLREDRPSISDSIASMDLPTLIALARTFDRYRGLADEAVFRSHFEGLFVARIERNTGILAQSLVWIFHLEALLRQFLVEVAINSLGNEWYSVVRAAAERIGVPDVRPEAYSFRDTVSILAYLVHNDRVHSAHVDRRLGGGWEQQMRDLAEPFDGIQIRNDMAHGLIYDSAERYWEHWSELAERVFGAAAIYIRLRSQQLWDEVQA